MFSLSLLLKRRNKIREKIKGKKVESLLIFHQPNIFYLTGFRGEGVLLLLKDDGILITDYRYLPSSLDSGDWKFFGTKKGYLSSIKDILRNEKIKKVALETDHISLSLWKKLNKMEGIRWFASRGWIEEERMVKDEEEIKLIEKALSISKKVLNEVHLLLNERINENNLAVEIEYRLRKYGSEDIPFSPIVASGENSSLPHAVPSKKEIREKDHVIVDLGARFNGYCSDITETFFLGRKERIWKKRENLIKEAINIALDCVEEGISAKEIQRKVLNFFRKEKVRKHFLHSLGHGVGIEIHEKPFLSLKGREKIKNNMVFTLEPGLYFSGEGGVRKEIMVLVRNGKAEVL